MHHPSRNRLIPDSVQWRNGLIACLLFAYPAVAKESPDPGPAARDKVADVIHGRAVEHLVNGVVVVTEAEFNDYVSEHVKARPVAGLDSVVIQLLEGTLGARVTVDVTQMMRGGLSMALPGVDAGPVIMTGEVGFGSSGGRLHYTFRKASMGGMSLPRMVVEGLLTQFLGASNSVLLTGDIPLWEGIESVKVGKGKLVIQGSRGDAE